MLAYNTIRQNSDLRPLAVKARRKHGEWTVVAEVAGTRLMTPEQVRTVETRLQQAADGNVRLTVFAKVEAMLDSNDYMIGQ